MKNCPKMNRIGRYDTDGNILNDDAWWTERSRGRRKIGCS